MKQELLYIYTVYQEGSFSRAAEKLYMTQPALSISIQKIEQAVGMPLFDRSRRPLRLTEAGEVYIDIIRKKMLLEREQEERLQDIRNLVSGNLVLGVTHYLIAYILPDILAGFSKQYPGVHLEIMEAGSAVLAQMLADQKVDVIFSCDPILTKEYTHREAFMDHVLLAVPRSDPINDRLGEFALTAQEVQEKKHLHKDCPAVNLREFAELEFILLNKGNNLHERAWSMFREVDMAPKIRMTLSQMVTAYRLAAAGMGATFASDRLVCAENTNLCFYKIESRYAMRSFSLLLPRREYTSRAVRGLVDYVQKAKL